MQNPTAGPVEGTNIVRIVVGEDRLDVYNAPALRDLSVQLASELKYLQILDLEGVHDADSTGLGVIYGADKRALNHGGALVLVNVGQKLANTLRITGLAKQLTIASDLESAVAFFNPAQLEDDPEPEDVSTNGGGPSLDETSPDLIHALTVLADRYGWLGIERTVAKIQAEIVEYETDSEAAPADGDHGTCVFGDPIRYVARPTGGWWAHETHPADGHDAELGGPA